MTNFNFQAKTIFLTYAQCNLTKEELLTELHQLFSIKEYCIAEEHHEDGSPHLHAFLQLTGQIHKRVATFADVKGFHPNITAPRSIKAVIKYVQKDGNCLTSEGIKDLLDKKSYGQLIAESTNTVSFLNAVKKNYPRDMVMNYEKIKVFAEYQFQEPVPEFISPYSTNEFNVDSRMTEWAKCLEKPMNNPKVFIKGAARHGYRLPPSEASALLFEKQELRSLLGGVVPFKLNI